MTAAYSNALANAIALCGLVVFALPGLVGLARLLLGRDR